MEIGAWLQRLLPKVEAYGWRESCWVAHVKTRTPEHHPPLYWLGRALDVVEAGGGLDRLRARLVEVHGAEACPGWSEQDQRAQDVLSAACAFAWATEHLGAPEVVERDGHAPLLRVDAVDAAVAPRRMRPVRSLEQLLEQVAEGAPRRPPRSCRRRADASSTSTSISRSTATPVTSATTARSPSRCANG